MKIMLDLETLSTSSNAAIISIGAVKFNENEITDRFYQTIKADTVSGHICPATVAWWFKQEKEAQNALFENSKSLPHVLHSFNDFCTGSEELWGNGASFDNVILRNAYTALKIGFVLPFRTDRCYKTVRSMTTLEPPQFLGTRHNALHDAEYQANYLINILQVDNYNRGNFK